MIVLATVFFLTSVFSAHAQQPQQQFSQQELQRIISALEIQRNQALSSDALNQAKASGLQEENTKLKAEIEELKKAKPDK
jgi:Skp family chaperone for outer membrane proteins